MVQLADSIEIEPVTRPIDASIRLPGSKSYTNRALIVAALARGTSRLEGALASDDTRYMVDALRSLGIDVERLGDSDVIVVKGESGAIPASVADLYVGNAGTAARFLTALVALGKGTYRIDGVPRMRERPIGRGVHEASRPGKRRIGDDDGRRAGTRLPECVDFERFRTVRRDEEIARLPVKSGRKNDLIDRPVGVAARDAGAARGEKSDSRNRQGRGKTTHKNSRRAREQLDGLRTPPVRRPTWRRR